MKKLLNNFILFFLFSSLVFADVELTKDVEFRTASNVTYTTQVQQNYDIIEVDDDFFKADEVNSTITGNATMYIISYNSSNVILNSTGSLTAFTFNGVNAGLFFFYRAVQNLPHHFNQTLDGIWDNVYTGPFVPIVVPPAGGDTGAGAKSTIITNATPINVTQKVADITQQIICDNSTFVNRLFSKCKIEKNGICDDGENFIADSECKFNLRDVKELKPIKMMWFLRFVLIAAVILLFLNSKEFPLISSLLLFLFMHNGAFSKIGADATMCRGVNAVMNAGYCASPSNPLFGWVIAFTVLALFIVYLSPAHRKQTQVNYSRIYAPILASLLILMIKLGVFFSGEYDKARCVDVQYVMNAGYCIMPNKPLLGWIIAFAIVALILAYFDKEKTKKKNTEREKRRKELQEKLYTEK